MRTVLVTRHVDAAFLPLALLYLKAALVDSGAATASEVDILEFGPEARAPDIASAVLLAEPDVLALSCYVWNVVELMRAAQLVAAERPGTCIVAGGPEVGGDGAAALARYPALDVVVTGEGERTLVNLVGRWQAGRRADDLPGTCQRGAGAPHGHDDAPVALDLDGLPSPHARGFVGHANRIACIETMRGCPFGCGFCYYGKGGPSAVRTFELSRVEADLGFWLEQDVRQIYLMDPVFNLDARRAKAVCRVLAARNRRRVPVHAEIRAELVDDELAALMKAAGFEYLEVGLQSIERSALAGIGRRPAGAEFLAGVEHLRAHALPFELQIIFGLPGDTLETWRRALDFAASLRPDYLSSFLLMVLPGTSLRRQADRLGVAFDPEPPYYVRSTPSMDADAVRQGRGLAPAVRLLWNSGAVRWLHDRQGVAMSEVVRRWDDWRAGAGMAAGAGPTPVSTRAFVRAVCVERGLAPDFAGTCTRAEAEPCLRRLNRLLAAG